MLDCLAEQSGNVRNAGAAILLETAIDTGFSDNRLRSMEFGGDMGTKAITNEVLDIILSSKT